MFKLKSLIILLILIISISLVGCSNGCIGKPTLIKEGKLKSVEYVTDGGLFGGISTILRFQDGTILVLTGSFNILYENIKVYGTCPAMGSYIIEESKVEKPLFYWEATQ